MFQDCRVYFQRLSQHSFDANHLAISLILKIRGKKYFNELYIIFEEDDKIILYLICFNKLYLKYDACSCLNRERNVLKIATFEIHC